LCRGERERGREGEMDGGGRRRLCAGSGWECIRIYYSPRITQGNMHYRDFEFSGCFSI